MLEKQVSQGLSSRLYQILGKESVSAFARRCNIGDSVVRSYLTGSKPSLDNATKIAQATGVSLEWLATGGGDIHTGKTDPSRPLSLRENQAPYAEPMPSLVSLNRENPLTTEEAQFATFPVWKDFIALTQQKIQAVDYHSKDVDPDKLADYIATRVIEYARKKTKERKDRHLLTNDPGIETLKRRKS